VIKVNIKAKAFDRVRKLIASFDDLASGVVLGHALVKSVRYLDGRIRGELGDHVRTGAALAATRVTGSPSLIRSRFKAYALAGNFKPGSKSAPARPAGHIKWSFFRGIPNKVIAHIGSIYRGEIRKALKA
jgi:hypothetical protein